MGKWTWILSKQARKEFDALDPKLKKSIAEHLNLLAQQSPSCLVKKLNKDVWRLRIGNWRVFFTKDHDILEILVVEIARRKTTTY